MKIIFLDIDGVLNSIETFIRRHEKFKISGVMDIEIDQDMVNNLKGIIDKTDAKIVLSSSWRIFFNKVNNEIVPNCQKGLQLMNIFKENNIFIYDMTPDSENRKRGVEISLWLLSHNDVTNFVILDDDIADLLELITHVITTSFQDADELGLCASHMQEAIEKLNTKKESYKLPYVKNMHYNNK